ncbi:MAG: Na/Pi cotransporter family protein, partial [Oscillospiraceae bacterium]|nr:Na/Pi cotransporter family protein [Oscillospiraceae bacterium]
MDLFGIISLCGGLAFFLFGMTFMSTGLEKMAGSRLEKALKTLTSNVFRGLGLGVSVTAIIQSSSAVTVMLVGLVNSGIMKLGQTVGVIMGTNIGTTVTAWLISTIGIESSNPFIKLLKPESFSPILALIGVLLIMLSKKGEKKADLGTILIGFAILMYGMKIMSESLKPLAEIPEFVNIFTMFSNPLLGVLAGAVFTGIIQSSSASVGILQALSMSGTITFGTAIPIIMGQNIGTCVTALLSSIGTNKNAKRVAIIHITFNIIGTILFLSLFYIFHSIINFAFINESVNALNIAIIHSIFNISTTIVLLPLNKLLEQIACLIIRDSKDQPVEKYELLDDRLLMSPSFAIAECQNMTIDMAKLARDTLFLSIELIENVENFNQKQADLITENENLIDMYEDKLGTYLVKLSSKELSLADSERITKLLHTIGDFERISDHAINILDAATEMNEKKITFSPEAQTELKVISSAVTEILTIATDAFINNDLDLAAKVEPLEQVIDALKDSIKIRHINRLKQG